MSPTFRMCLTAGLLFAAATVAGAAGPTPEERAQIAVETRQGLFKVIVSYFGPIVAMAREQIPYDGDRVATNAAKISQLAPMIPDMLAPDTSAFDFTTEALDHIWDNLDDIQTKADNLAAAAAGMAAAAAEGQAAAMSAFREVGGACKACHDEYREQD